MPLWIVRQDITRMKVDAVVVATNEKLQPSGGVGAAVFKAAGAIELAASCAQLAPIAVGQAVITPGFRLPARHIIHAAGPAYDAQAPSRSDALLSAAYANALVLAAQHGLESAAFPLISSGQLGYPKQRALQVARQAIERFLQAQELGVYLAVFDKDAFAISRELLGEVESFIDQHYVDLHTDRRRRMAEPSATDSQPLPMLLETSSMPQGQGIAEGLESMIGQLDASFSTTLLQLIDQKGMEDTEVYKRANISRKLFSKIRSNRHYKPSLPTALALAIGLRLSLPETEDLLRRAGLALSNSRKFDVIIQFFILKGHYDIYAINEMLYQYDQPLLGQG